LHIRRGFCPLLLLWRKRIVKRLYIDDYTDIVELMYEKVCGSCEEATFIGLYEDAVEILKQLVI